MTFDVRQVVTDRATGRSVFAEEAVTAPDTGLGLEIHNIWSTADGKPFVGAGDNSAGDRLRPSTLEARVYRGRADTVRQANHDKEKLP